MQGIIFDIDNIALKKYLGYKSYLDVSVFHKTIGDFLLKELYYCGADDVLIFRFSEIKNSFDIIQDDVICVFSNLYINLENNSFSKATEYLKEFYLSDTDGNVCGFYCNSQKLRQLISESMDDSDFYGKIIGKSFSFPQISCANKVIAIDNCNEYISMLAKMFDDFYVDLPEIAQGIYASSSIPKGDYVIIPPVYIGEGVQIERGSVIGPYTIIGDNVLIATNSDIKRSVILENTYISDNCFVDGSICCANSSLRRSSAVFKGSVIGRDSILGEKTIIENGTYLQRGTVISNINFTDSFCNAGKSREGVSFYGYTPSKAALLGCCIGNILNEPSIAVMSDGELNSTSLKLSLLGGLVSVGAGCYDFGKGYLSSIFYFMDFCELDYGLFISGNTDGTAITLVDNKNEGLSHIQMNNLSLLMISGNIKFSPSEKCRQVRVIRTPGRLYIQNLVNIVGGSLNFSPIFKCKNKSIRAVLNSAISKVKINSFKNQIVFIINEKGNRLSAEYKGSHFNDETLKRIVSYYSFLKGGNNINNLIDYDSVILCFRLMRILSENNTDLITAEKSLPSVYIADEEIDYNKELSTLASHISEYADVSYKKDALIIEDDKAYISVSEIKNKNRLKISVKASSFEVASDISGRLVDYIRRFMNN